jgi:hypothetical protein
MIKKYKQFLKESGGDAIAEPAPIPTTNPEIEGSPKQAPNLDPRRASMEEEEPSQRETDSYNGEEMMKLLSIELGVDLLNNSIEYNGHKIDFPSEINRFRIDGQDTKLDNIDGILSKLDSQKSTNDDDNFLNRKEEFDSELESIRYRTSRNFNKL